MTSVIIKKAKKDIMSFFYDKDRIHWIYKYGNNANANVTGKSVFYFQQLKILFEEKYFHWNTGYALYELVEEGELDNWKQVITDEKNRTSKEILLFKRPDIDILQETQKRF